MTIGGLRREEAVADEPNPGTLISGTHRPEDLIPAFTKEIKRICTVLPRRARDAIHFAEENPDISCDVIRAIVTQSEAEALDMGSYLIGDPSEFEGHGP